MFHKTYNHDKSSEYKEDGRKYQTPEGAYTLKGFFSYDNISVSALTLVLFLNLIFLRRIFIRYHTQT